MDVEFETGKQVCRTCRHTFPRNTTYFHRDSQCAAGLKLQCRSCACAQARRRYASNSSAVLERQRRRRQERNELFANSPEWQPATR
ncbi:hypothetical protein ACFU6O_20725 [Streptomyces albidoflavus]